MATSFFVDVGHGSHLFRVTGHGGAQLELEGSFGLRIRHLFMVLLGGRRPEAWNVVGVINCTSDQYLTHDYPGVQEHRIALMPEQGSLY